jgi:hypothetical protein
MKRTLLAVGIVALVSLLLLPYRWYSQPLFAVILLAMLVNLFPCKPTK